MKRKDIQEAHEKYYLEYDNEFKDMKIETQCIHTGQNPDWTFGSINVPYMPQVPMNYLKQETLVVNGVILVYIILQD